MYNRARLLIAYEREMITEICSMGHCATLSLLRARLVTAPASQTGC
jgi:hypothetical protein